jgi:hypothetical protein
MHHRPLLGKRLLELFAERQLFLEGFDLSRNICSLSAHVPKSRLHLPQYLSVSEKAPPLLVLLTLVA